MWRAAGSPQAPSAAQLAALEKAGDLERLEPDRYVDATGGAIALVRNGDTITIDIPNRKIDVSLSEEELDVRRAAEYSRGAAAFKPQRQRPIPQALRAYALFAASADKGAVRIIPESV